jgi:hypothetical protein
LTEYVVALDRVRRLGDAYSKSPLSGGYPAHSVLLAASWANNEPPIHGRNGRLSRAQVLDLAKGASDAASCFEVFVYAMAWGYGDNGYGPFRTNRVIDSMGSPEKCGEFVWGLKCAAAEGWKSGYNYLASHRVMFFGPAFATKILYFVSPETNRSPILDSVVSGWLWSNDVATKQQAIDSRIFDDDQYARFVQFVDLAAATLKNDVGIAEAGDRGFVEYLLFYDRLFMRSMQEFPPWIRQVN